MLDRRHFLIGAGALLTASFVSRASAFSQKAGEPLILPPVCKPEETLYVYMQDYEVDENDESPSTTRSGACRSALISRSRRRLRLGVSICVRSGIPSTRRTRSTAFAESMICVWTNSTST